MSHTPGPWIGGAFVVHSTDSVICDCVLPQNHALPPDEKIANIRLIAAAPDLLAVLEYIARMANRPVGDAGEEMSSRLEAARLAADALAWVRAM